MQCVIFAGTLMVVTIIAIFVGLGLIWSDEVAKARLKRRVPGAGRQARRSRRASPSLAVPPELGPSGA